MLQSIRTAAKLIGQCGRLYVELALSAATLLPASLRSGRASDELTLVAES